MTNHLNWAPDYSPWLWWRWSPQPWVTRTESPAGRWYRTSGVAVQHLTQCISTAWWTWWWKLRPSKWRGLRQEKRSLFSCQNQTKKLSIPHLWRVMWLTEQQFGKVGRLNVVIINHRCRCCHKTHKCGYVKVEVVGRHHSGITTNNI